MEERRALKLERKLLRMRQRFGPDAAQSLALKSKRRGAAAESTTKGKAKSKRKAELVQAHHQTPQQTFKIINF